MIPSSLDSSNGSHIQIFLLLFLVLLIRPCYPTETAPQFDHEKLRVYAVSLEFVTWATVLIDETRAKAAVKDQLDRASSSVPLNIAEGNVKWTPADRAKFFRIAAGSAAECAACLDVFVSKGFCASERVAEGKDLLLNIVSMLIALAHSFEGRVREDDLEHGKGDEEEEEK